MAQIHILEREDYNRIRCLFHYSTPDVIVQPIGIQLRTVILKELPVVDPYVFPNDKNINELQAIAEGRIYEEKYTFTITIPGVKTPSSVQMQDWLIQEWIRRDADYTEKCNRFLKYGAQLTADPSDPFIIID